MVRGLGHGIWFECGTSSWEVAKSEENRNWPHERTDVAATETRDFFALFFKDKKKKKKHCPPKAVLRYTYLGKEKNRATVLITNPTLSLPALEPLINIFPS